MSDSIAEGRRLHKFPRGYSKEDMMERQAILENFMSVNFQEPADMPPESLQGIIENQIGEMSIPMGMAGPLSVEGRYAKGDFYVPLCTVEGTLVASMTRGMYATHKSGGIRTAHLQQRMSRAPIFFFESISSQHDFLSWISEHEQEIKCAAEATTGYGKLLQIEPYVLNRYVILDFGYETGNAAGQNMVSKATKNACEYIRHETGVDFVLDSNFSSDKKSSGITRLKGRGHFVSAQAFLSHQVIEKVLGTTAKSLNKIQEFGPYASNAAGNQGVQLHLSNALAAIYLATGQDVACVAENAVGFTQTKLTEEGMEFLLTMPSISVGTVGGGTRLPQQQKCLKLLGCDTDENGAKKLAEIICASALCLEISLMAAIVSEKWVGAHMKYGRNKN